MSPELLNIHVNPEEEIEYDEGVDLWAVGIMTYYMLCADYPFEITK